MVRTASARATSRVRPRRNQRPRHGTRAPGELLATRRGLGRRRQIPHGLRPLLYDSKQILSDQLEHWAITSERRGDGHLNLALLTDGLRADALAGNHDRRRLPLLPDTELKFHRRHSPATSISTAPVHGAHHTDLSGYGRRAQRRQRDNARHLYITTSAPIPHRVVCVNRWICSIPTRL